MVTNTSFSADVLGTLLSGPLSPRFPCQGGERGTFSLVQDSPVHSCAGFGTCDPAVKLFPLWHPRPCSTDPFPSAFPHAEIPSVKKQVPVYPLVSVQDHLLAPPLLARRLRQPLLSWSQVVTIHLHTLPSGHHPTEATLTKASCLCC